MDHELIWLQPDEEIPEKEQHTVQSEKVIITIVWNINGFHPVKLLPKGFKFNPSYYVTQIFDPLSVWRGTQTGRTVRKLIVCADNAHPYIAKVTLDFMERNAMKRALHPPYSPDLAQSDFHLFGHVKQPLRECEFADREAFLDAIEDILRSIEKVILKDVFLSWMERLRQCGRAAGEYV
jgi:histone-lysine N-methyltransferase SETMAR